MIRVSNSKWIFGSVCGTRISFAALMLSKFGIDSLLYRVVPHLSSTVKRLQILPTVGSGPIIMNR
jgi:hypothetical protein